MKIPDLDHASAEAARTRQNTLTKPLGALGRLETLSIELCGMTGDLTWLPLPATVLVFAADHGVAAQGVSAYPQSVTEQMVLNFLRGGAAVNVLARQMNARLCVIDAGIIRDLPAHPLLIAGKVARGTRDLSTERAMSVVEAASALALGSRVANGAIDAGARVLVMGEMGSGNTTSATAIIAALSGERPHALVGRGTGLGDAHLAHKLAIVEQALALHAPKASDDGVEILSKIGGFEIGAIAGGMLAAATRRVPVMIDGVISSAAAMIAAQIDRDLCNYLVASHLGAEPAHGVALRWLGITPLLALELRLGEGTGGLLALPLLEAAMRTLQEMATFAEAAVDLKSF